MGHRTLVLGAYHYCWYGKCRYFKECVVEGRVADYDTVCPEYERMSDRDYYRLSNSNVIEIDSYLEGEHYPAILLGERGAGGLGVSGGVCWGTGEACPQE